MHNGILKCEFTPTLFHSHFNRTHQFGPDNLWYHDTVKWYRINVYLLLGDSNDEQLHVHATIVGLYLFL